MHLDWSYKKQIKELGNKVRYQYNKQGFLESITNQNGYKAKYEYDIYGNKTKEVDGNGVITSYVYNELNNVIITIKEDIVTII